MALNPTDDIANMTPSDRTKRTRNCPGSSEAHQEHMHINGECPWCGTYDKSKWL